MENDVYRAKPKKRKRLKWIPVTFFLVLYLFRQLYLINANSVYTVKASEGYINDSIISPGIICREEIVLNYSGAGVVDYIAGDGERISKGNLIARIYPGYKDLDSISILRNRQQMIEDIGIASDYINNPTIDMTVTRKQLSQQLSQLSTLTQNGSYENINSNLADVTLSLNKIGVATGRVTDFAKAEKQLNSEISAIKSGINSPVDSLYSSYTGYFLQSADGYESLANKDTFKNSDWQSGENIINGLTEVSVSDNRYAKIITDYKWELCTYIDSSEASKIKKGNSLKLSVKAGNNIFYKTTVKEIVDKGEKTLLVLECSEMNTEIAKIRIADCEILFKQYKGIRIPKSALHFSGEQMGVYVNFSNLVQFKKITPVFEDDNYVIVPTELSENNQVKLHDAIIVKGRNLYDGKYL